MFNGSASSRTGGRWLQQLEREGIVEKRFTSQGRPRPRLSVLFNQVRPSGRLGPGWQDGDMGRGVCAALGVAAGKTAALG